jgi:uncharacterized membrane protein YgaE (UPF0421/DUF939 family)
MIKLPKVGMRIVKTALAIVITLSLTDVVLRSLFGIFFSDDFLSVSIAVVACIVVMQDTIKGTLRASKERIEATAIGSGIGVIMMGVLLLFEREEWHDFQRFLFYILSGFGSMLVIYVCMIIKGRSLTSLSVIVYIAVLFAYTNEYPIAYAGIRLLETFVGIGVTIAVNVIIAPPPFYLESKTSQSSHNPNIFLTRCSFCVKPKGDNNRCEDCQEDVLNHSFCSHDNIEY